MSDSELAILASSWWIAVLFFAWGIAEATVQPIVPDVGLGFLALATPAALGLPLAAAMAGGVLGAVVLTELGRRRPDVVDRVLSLQPGLGAAGMDEARRRLRERGWAAFAQLGPGLPLKAYVVAYLRDDPRAALGTIAGLAAVNRFTRIAPVVAAFTVVGVLARPLELDRLAVLIVYLSGWAIFYAAFWWVRRPRGRPWEPL
ncbi:MAG TPA: hypothetical protein VFU17_16130 [Candidatus Limnocylindrales bacterium]|nr:hypothetical protein [Candidatus Limnocylindrales bacterium]